MKVIPAQSCLSDPKDGSLPGSSVHGVSQARILEVGSHSLFQGVFPTHGWNPHLSHCRQILSHLSYQESLREDPEIHQIQTQNQANQNDWPKKIQKKCPIKVIQTTTRMQLSNSF